MKKGMLTLEIIDDDGETATTWDEKIPIGSVLSIEGALKVTLPFPGGPVIVRDISLTLIDDNKIKVVMSKYRGMEELKEMLLKAVACD